MGARPEYGAHILHEEGGPLQEVTGYDRLSVRDQDSFGSGGGGSSAGATGIFVMVHLQLNHHPYFFL